MGTRHMHPSIVTAIATLSAVFAVTSSTHAQWIQATGTTNLNMQSLGSRGSYAFAGGATGAYRSADLVAGFVASNSGNDAAGPTRGFATDAGFIYTCTSQGVFRSANDGATWISKSVGMTTVLCHGIVHVQSKLFVTGPAGVFRSDNQGDQWTAAGLAGTDVRCITAIDSTLFVGTNSLGIYKSTNWGVTWTAINNGLTSTTFRAIEAKGETLFAGGQVGTGVFRSTDLGASWTLLGGGLTSGSYRGFASNGSLIVAGSFGAGVFYSRNNGTNWTAINTGLTDLQIFDLAIQGDTLLAATNTKGVFRFPLSILIDRDLDGNGCIGGGDLTFLFGAWGSCTNCVADLDGDGVVSATDIAELLAHWGECG
ncbi:MAG: hypothetical protein O2800_07550 [Planctomycetota bacterium]|nr:hypothetical protein [Planctomycetota bacterium]